MLTHINKQRKVMQFTGRGFQQMNTKPAHYAPQIEYVAAPDGTGVKAVIIAPKETEAAKKHTAAKRQAIAADLFKSL